MTWFRKIWRRLMRRIRPPKLSLMERIGIEAVRRRHRGQSVRDVTVNPISFWTEARALSAKCELYGEWEFIRLMTAGGTVRVFSDPDCPADEFHFCEVPT